MELELEPLNFPSDQERPCVIAGPCSAETEEQVMTTAKQLAAKGCHMFRAGVWKPRTKPGGFEGNGETALPWMKQVKEETGMLTATEVATPEHVELALKYGIDILWVGARTSANPFAMQALADSLQGVDVPVLVKNPVNPDLELWIGALQRINQAGIKKLGAIHRGFSSFDKKIYRNLPMWQIPIELHRRIPQLPIICDPSHIGGRRDLIAPLCQQAMDLGFDGLIVESHCSPDDAWSDAKQQVTPEVLDYILSLLVVRDEHYSTEGLHQLRGQIDECDNQLMDLLAKRMRVCREIGTYKKEHNMTIVQTSRYNEILDKRGAQAALCGMSPEFAAQIFEHIHEESVRQQLKILSKNKRIQAMRILIMGAGKMGSFFIDLLSFDHEVAVYEKDAKRLRFTYNCYRFTKMEEIEMFRPELVINAVTVKYTLPAFEEVLPHLSHDCIISDIASVKTGLQEFYEKSGFRFVSTHPMFGPTFANLNQLSEENAVIIKEGDYMGKIFFKDLYQKLGLSLHEYTFDEHDQTVAYSLSIPFVSTFAFAAVMKHQDAPGTTFKRHMQIAKGVLNEDDYLLQEILFNPYTSGQVAQIREELAELIDIIDHKDAKRMKLFLTKIRNHVKEDIEIKEK